MPNLEIMSEDVCRALPLRIKPLELATHNIVLVHMAVAEPGTAGNTVFKVHIMEKNR